MTLTQWKGDQTLYHLREHNSNQPTLSLFFATAQTHSHLHRCTFIQALSAHSCHMPVLAAQIRAWVQLDQTRVKHLSDKLLLQAAWRFDAWASESTRCGFKGQLCHLLTA